MTSSLTVPNPSPALAVACSALGDRAGAMALAERLELPFIGVVKPRQVRDFDLLLFSDEQGLGLQATGKGAPGPVRVDFSGGKAGYRREHGGGTGQLVARAVGLQKTRAKLHVLDATAGLGQDAFVLAGLGCTLTLFERSPIVHALLADGLERGRMSPAISDIVARMTLHEGSSIDWLASAGANVADVIYLDPMFPHRDKSAAVKKEMQLFRPVVGDDDDAPGLLAAALNAATYRVVVKRPRKSPSIEGPEPATRIEGKSSRYDIYPIKALPGS